MAWDDKPYRVKHPNAKGGSLSVRALEPTPQQQRQMARRRKEFAKVPLMAAAVMMKATGTIGAMLVIVLFYLAWKHDGAPFPLSNALPARYGIGRETKRRMLQKLERAGLIKVERRARHAPTVTLLLSHSVDSLP